MEKRGIINAFWLKMLMCALMLLDHIYYFLPGQPIWFTMAGRLVAPVFVFLMTEGLVHTRNRMAYIWRMLLFGGGMMVGNLILALLFGAIITNSILLSLGFTAWFITCLDRWRQERGPVLLLAAVGLFCAACLFEGMLFCPLLGVIFYYLRSRPLQMSLAYVAASVLFTFGLQYGEIQLLMVLALVPILLYNGRRGYNGVFSKYFFYLFYPGHIWVLYLVARLGELA